MVQVSSSTPTRSRTNAKNFQQTCSFCGERYMSGKANTNAKYHTCDKPACQREHDRVKRQESRDASLGSWETKLGRFQPGQVIATFIAKVSGGRFTSSGGAQVTFTVGSKQKYLLVDVTDYTEMMVRVTVERLEDREQEISRGEIDE